GEEASKPGYTAAGARAAHDSLLNAGDRPADSFAAGDVFDDAPNHLFALMDPAVAVIGADQTDFELGFFGTVSLSFLALRHRPPPARRRAASPPACASTPTSGPAARRRATRSTARARPGAARSCSSTSTRRATPG